MTRRRRRVLLLALVLLLAASLALPGAGADPDQTTSLTVIRYGFDNKTVAESVTVTVSWMEQHLPVMGDGVTPYYFQGPTVIANPTEHDLWNPEETVNIDRLNESLRGTAVRDLVGLVGGMHPGDVVRVRASDGNSKRLGYANVYNPPARQGPPILAWWNQKYGYGWNASMRLYFLADTSVNPFGWHVFGNEDMRKCLPESEWHWVQNLTTHQWYPAASGLSLRWVAYLEIFPAPRALQVPGGAGVPRDLDANGKYEDVNGNVRKDFADVVLYFNRMTWIAANEPLPFFDYNANGRVDFADVVRLFNAL